MTLLSKILPVHSAPPTISRDAVNMLYQNVYRGAVMTVIAFSCLVFGFGSEPAMSAKPVLWALMVVVSVMRMVDGLRWRFCHPEKRSVSIGFMRFAAGNLMTSMLWCAYAVLSYQHMGLLELASTIVVLSAMAGGAATVLAPSKALSFSYSTFLLLPIAMLALIDPEQQFQLLGILGVGFWLVMLSTTAQSNAFFLQVVGLKEHNSKLLDDMQRKRAEVVHINEALRTANEQLDQNNMTLEQQVNERTRELFDLSNQDGLTGLLNRTGLKAYLEGALDVAHHEDTTLAVLFIDLDGFKKVNDTLGHAMGDQVLVTTAQRLAAHCPAAGVGRWGGDEFILVIQNLIQQQAVALAETMRVAVCKPIKNQHNHITLDATIGIALYPHHGNKVHTLIEKADFAMYQQKRAQRGAVCVFNKNLFEQVRLEEARLAGLTKAIEHNELTVAYQPIVAAETHQIISVEALLRWEFDGEIISPVVFIPLAEKCGLINTLGLWVLERACTEMQQLDPTPAPALSVNVSVLQLLEEDFIANIDRVLHTTGFAPERLHLEITESALAQNRLVLDEKVGALKARQIQISIDDFGTGFSSLSQLQLLSFDRIKIDKSFVMNFTSSNQAIVRATLMIAKEFGCQTVAEGVETRWQAQQLQSMGVSHLQGYYFARPMPLNPLADWLTQQEN
ncbi:EAL domain-containing protein [Salinimonas marina]|uniref:EAL domain-containing protein n=1 Tax=Salinimonas marina TaxID=2785918 RepID=A0A7S9HDK6_9ALTE|nr:EAL domain-containing protein [Salinimonas marina]QPG06366.1 EAL domain-containing protein [Salinimonas marina]